MGLFEEYDALLDEADQLKNPQARSSLYTMADSNPDQEAGLHKLAQKVALPVEALRKDQGAEAKRLAVAQGVELLDDKTPATLEFMSSHENAALAHDDLDNLTGLEKLVRAFKSGREQQEAGRLSYRQMVGEPVENKAITDLEARTAQAQQMIDSTKDFGFLTAAQIAGQMFDSADTYLRPALAAGVTAAGVAGAMGQAGPQVLLPEEIITMPAAALSAFGTTLAYGFIEDTRKVEAGSAFRSLQEMVGEDGEGLDPNTMVVAAQTVGLVNAAIEGLGLKLISAPYRAAVKRAVTQEAAKKGLTQLTARGAVGNFAKAYGTQVGAETGQEIAQEVVNVVAEEMAKRNSEGNFESATPEEVGARLWEIASKTAQGMAWLGLPGAGISLREDLAAAKAAKVNSDFMTALGEVSTSSKLRGRLPEKFQALVAKIREGGPVENVFVPADSWKSFWQERGSDPQEIAASLGLGADYNQALTAGSDLVIPLDVYATQLAPSEHHADLTQDIRLRQGDMTPREADAFRGTLAERMDELLQQVPSESDSSTQVYDAILGELLGTGRDRSTAEQEAQLWQLRYKARAAQLGIDANELYQRYPVRVTRDVPGFVTRRDFVDTSIDPMLDRLRGQEAPAEKQVFGTSLLSFLRLKGVRDDSGDLRSMDVDKGLKPFTRKLVRPDGMSLDEAGEALWEAGYFAERPTEAEVLDAIDGELRGDPRYADANIDNTALQQRADLEEMQLFLEQNNIDLATMSNQQVRDVLAKAIEAQGGGTNFAQAERDAFLRWAGTDELIESEEINDYDFSGEGPFVMRVFHGTTNEFEVFDSTIKGSSEGQFGRVNYFTSSESDARDNYAGEGPDLTQRIELKAERLADEITDRYEEFDNDEEGVAALKEEFGEDVYSEDHMEMARAIVRKELHGGNEKVLELYIKTEKPFVANDSVSPWFEFFNEGEIDALAVARVADNEGMSVEEIEENRDDYDEQITDARYEVMDEEGNQLITAIQTVAERYDFDASDLFSAVYEMAADGSIRHDMLEELLRRDESLSYAEDPESGEIIQSHMIGEIIQELGFDSIILKNADTRFKSMNMESGTAHIHIFDANNSNIKSVNNVGTFDPNNPNILYQSPLQNFPDGVVLDQRIQGGNNAGFNTEQPEPSRFGQSQENDFATVAVIAGRGYRAGTANDGTDIRSREEADLRAYAEQNNLFLSAESMLQEVEAQEISGTDNHVFFRDGAYIKINRFTHAPTFTDLFSNIALHNNIFSEIPYTFEGFTEIDGRLHPVFSQPAMRNELLDNPKELERLAAEALIERGFTRQDGQFGFVSTAKFVKGDLVIRDINSRNVALQNGEVLFFDPVVEIEPTAKKNDGMRTFFQSGNDFPLSALHNLTADNLLHADKRGSITFGPIFRDIALLGKADLSTFLHESGHAWLEELRQDALHPNASEQLRADWLTIAAWTGIDANTTDIPVDAHEQFARGIEAYIREGKAPTLELTAAFRRFSAWLKMIYKQLKDLNVTLTDDVRGVMDRLFASDEEINLAREAQKLTPIFADAAAAGMSEREFAAYRKVVEKAHAEAEEKLRVTLMKELAREETAAWQEAKRKVMAEVEAEAQEAPVYQVFHALTTGTLFDGTPAPDGFKIAKTDLVKMYGATFVKNLPRSFQRIYRKDGGWHPDAVAEIFGFTSGDEMIQTLANTPPLKQAVAAETEIRMRKLHGDLLHDGTLADEAQQAVHNDYSGEVLAAELRALRRQQNKVKPFVKAAQASEAKAEREERTAMLEGIPSLEMFRLWAAQAIGSKAIKDLRPDLYLKAEQKAGRAAFLAAGKGDFAKAGEAKQQQLLNHYLYKEATAAKEESEKIFSYADRLQKPAAQQRIGKAGGDYLDQINGLLELYEFKKTTLLELVKRQSLQEWARQQEEMGLSPAIPDDVLAALNKRNYRTLTIDELRGVRDALKNIEHLAKEINTLRIEGEEIDLQQALDELAASAFDNYQAKRIPLDKETRTWLEKKGELISRLDASLIKAEQLVEWLDGGKINGPWSRLIFRPIAAAESQEHDLTLRYTQVIAENFAIYGQEHDLTEKIFIPSLGEALTRQAIVAVALNTGNESNQRKLLEGNNWRPEQLQDVLSHLDATDWKFIQATWDTIEGLWPEIQAMEKRLSGVAPPKVVPREIVNQHGTFKGGYYPVVYDSRHSGAGAKQADARGEALFESNYVRATTAKGHTKARIEEAAYPILLSLDIIPQHIAQVIHDLTHREAVVNVSRLLSNKSMRPVLNQTVGSPYHKFLMQWLANVANDRNIDRTGNEFWMKFFSTLRTNATIVGMGFRATTMLTQIVGLSQSLDIVKGRYLAAGIKSFLRNPAATMEWVNEKSGEMRHRRNSLDRDIRDGVRKQMGQQGVKAWIQSKAFAGIGLFDSLVSTPTWVGAYQQAQAEGMGEVDAIAAGDRAVRLSQGSGGAKDLAAVQRSNDLMKLFTMFYSYFSVLYNRLRNAGRLKSIGEIGFIDLAWKSFIMVAVPAVMGELIADRGPDDDEDPAAWALTKIALYPLMSVPVLRDAANTLESGRAYQMSPMARVGDMLTKVPGQIEGVLTGEKEIDDLVFANLDLPGYLFGLPTGQLKNTTRYIWDVWNGEIDPEDASDILKGLTFGERRNK